VCARLERGCDPLRRRVRPPSIVVFSLHSVSCRFCPCLLLSSGQRLIACLHFALMCAAIHHMGKFHDMWWHRRDGGLDKTSLGHSALRICVLTRALPSTAFAALVSRQRTLRAGRQCAPAPLRARRADYQRLRRFCSTLPPGTLRLGLHWRGAPCSVPRLRAAPRLARRPRRRARQGQCTASPR
jgi:hypothetical protein